MRAILLASAAVWSLPLAAHGQSAQEQATPDHSAHTRHATATAAQQPEPAPATDHSQHTAPVTTAPPPITIPVPRPAQAGAQNHDGMAHGGGDQSAHGTPSAAAAREHQGADPSSTDHSGHTTPAARPVTTPPPLVLPPLQPAQGTAQDHANMNHGSMDHGNMDHSGHTAPAAPAIPVNQNPPARAAEGPAHAADAVWGEDTMARARAAMGREHGAMVMGSVMVERLEARIADGHDAWAWDVQGWWGGDLTRLVVKSEGEGEFGGPVESADVQLLLSHAIAPYFDLQAGARLDLEPDTRPHLVLGVQGMVPYFFEVDASAFLSDRGDLTAAIEAEYDQRITQRLILQPHAELALSAQDMDERDIGAGFTSIEAGLRLRYEITREFAPYIGVGYEAKLGETAGRARAAGEDVDGIALLLGLRAWF